jgi:nicotinate-nucleotide adenylyltransferase
MRIGLFGGSFDPPHEGHLMVAHLALRRLRLDRVWWLVSPQNPLKSKSPSHGLAARVAGVARMADHPRFVVTGVEAQIGSRYTADTLAWLKRRMPGVRLVWIMGADNMANFHLWHGWRRIADTMPIAVVDRPESSIPALVSPAAHALARSRVWEGAAAGLAERTPPAWVFLHGPRVPVSSTLLRNQRRRRRLESVKDAGLS